jgi:Alpha galactosidase A
VSRRTPWFLWKLRTRRTNHRVLGHGCTFFPGFPAVYVAVLLFYHVFLQFTKTDNCHKPSNYTEQELYGQFSQALNATGRPILFSLCEWGESNVESWGGSVGQMFRIQMDHLPFWELPSWANGAGAGFGGGTASIIEYVATLKISQYNQEVRGLRRS